MTTHTSSNHTERIPITLGISPCPNDTYIFYGVTSGRVHLEGAKVTVSHHDVETLNQAALAGKYDVTKLSFHAYLLVQEQYQLLETGAALGFGCGPLIVAKKDFPLDELPSCRIAVPGELTTAHLLLRLFCPEAHEKVFVRYDEVISLVASGEVDCGVIIHEDRFTYESSGLMRLTDLGEWWETLSGAPIPLGGIAMRRTLAPRFAVPFDALVRESIALSKSDPEKALPYIRQHAQQMESSVLKKHIRTFVNAHSMDLGPEGRRAVAVLQMLAKQAKVIP